MNAIFERRSIRRYTDKPIPKENILDILKAGMAAPSAGNERPWQFIVVDDKNVMNGIMKIHPYSQMLKEASHAIIVCADKNLRRFDVDFWVEDCSAATENMLIMAQHLGIGSVWLGLYPDMERVRKIGELLKLPDHVVPFAIIALGYPAEKKEATDRFDETRIHYNKW